MSELCRKAARQLNAAKFIKTNIDEETRMEIYRSFILSNFNYCPLVWHFCGVLNTKQWKEFRKGHYNLYIMILHHHMKSFWQRGTNIVKVFIHIAVFHLTIGVKHFILIT